MDTTEFSQGQYITAEVVKQSPTKTGIIIDEALGENTDFGVKLQCKVNFDGREKIWRLNRDSVKNMQTLSLDSKAWISTQVRFMVLNAKGKEIVVGVPMKNNIN